MKINWFLEADIYGDDIHELTKEIEAQGHDLKILSDMNHWDTKWLDLYNDRDCVVYYGGLELGYSVRREAPWVPGIYSSIENYDCTLYYPEFGPYLLNKNYVMIPYGELLRQKDFLYDSVGEDDAIFIRPNRGTKVFTGTLVYRERFEKDIDLMGFYETKPNELCVVCAPRNVTKEWRFLVVDNRVITGSQYRPGRHCSDVTDEIDDLDASLLAYRVIEETEYYPDRCWTLDICKTKEDNFYLLEVGCFSCAGLYAMDMKRVVAEVSQMAWKDWEEIYGD